MGLISNATTIFDAGAMASGFGGSMVFIKKLTASGTATLSFVNGASGVVLDNTYKEYLFTFNNIHPETGGSEFLVNFSLDTGSNYNVTKTTTSFRTFHQEGDGGQNVSYDTGRDLAQSTAFFELGHDITDDNDGSLSGTLSLFNPANTTFVKHFIAVTNTHQEDESNRASIENFKAGYCNTTSAIDAVQFKMSANNIDAGDICLYGIS
jgi:hypothetical protein